MLKKIVKFGNSNALILDRAILELLNMEEGSIVKLHTDGKSLTITPQQPAEKKEVLMTGTEWMVDYVQHIRKAGEELIKNDQDPEKKLAYAKLQEKYQEVMQKYKYVLNTYDTQDFMKRVDELAATKYEGKKFSPEFLAEVREMQLQANPQLAAFHCELEEASRNLGL